TTRPRSRCNGHHPGDAGVGAAGRAAAVDAAGAAARVVVDIVGERLDALADPLEGHVGGGAGGGAHQEDVAEAEQVDAVAVVGVEGEVIDVGGGHPGRQRDGDALPVLAAAGEVGGGHLRPGVAGAGRRDRAQDEASVRAGGGADPVARAADVGGVHV